MATTLPIKSTDANVSRRSTIKRSNTKNKSDEPSPEDAILGGGIRGAMAFLRSTIKVKMMVYKRAFLAIGQQTMGNETAVAVATPKRTTKIHPKILVYTQSTIMGMIVFGTYDGLIYAWQRHLRRTKSRDDGRHGVELDHGPMSSSGGGGGSSSGDGLDATTILVHGMAGTASGISRSVFWMGWEKLVYGIPHTWSFSWRSTIHHAVGHGVLFGSYNFLRTLAFEVRPIFLPPTGDSELVDEGEDRFPLLATCFAGGVAGQLHHISQHYTSHWRQFRSVRQLPPPPRIQPVLASFIPMALCFAVFEYGGDSAEEIVQQVQNMLES